MNSLIKRIATHYHDNVYLYMCRFTDGFDDHWRIIAMSIAKPLKRSKVYEHIGQVEVFFRISKASGIRVRMIKPGDVKTSSSIVLRCLRSISHRIGHSLAWPCCESMPVPYRIIVGDICWSSLNEYTDRSLCTTMPAVVITNLPKIHYYINDEGVMAFGHGQVKLYIKLSSK